MKLPRCSTTRSMLPAPWPGASRNVAPSSRTSSYSSREASTRWVQSASAHSQMNSVDPASKRSALSAIRSFTSRKALSVRAFLTSGESSMGTAQRRSAGNGFVHYRDTVKQWPEPVERVAAVLRAAAVDARVEEFADETPSAGAAARAAGCKRSEIVKSLVLVCDLRPVLEFVLDPKRAGAVRLSAAAGARYARVAKPDDVRSAR